jgi:hypothetical protein
VKQREGNSIHEMKFLFSRAIIIVSLLRDILTILQWPNSFGSTVAHCLPLSASAAILTMLKEWI